MSPTGFSEAKTLERFEGGLIDLYRRQGLFYQNPKAVEISEGVLYRDRKSVVSGKSVSVRVDLGGRRIIKKKNQNDIHCQHRVLTQHMLTVTLNAYNKTKE